MGCIDSTLGGEAGRGTGLQSHSQQPAEWTEVSWAGSREARPRAGEERWTAVGPEEGKGFGRVERGAFLPDAEGERGPVPSPPNFR